MGSTFFCCSCVGPGCGFCSCWFWGILASGTLEIERGGLEKESLVLVIIDAAARGGTEVIEKLLLAADAWEKAGLEFDHLSMLIKSAENSSHFYHLSSFSNQACSACLTQIAR